MWLQLCGLFSLFYKELLNGGRGPELEGDLEHSFDHPGLSQGAEQKQCSAFTASFNALSFRGLKSNTEKRWLFH